MVIDLNPGVVGVRTSNPQGLCQVGSWHDGAGGFLSMILDPQSYKTAPRYPLLLRNSPHYRSRNSLLT